MPPHVSRKRLRSPAAQATTPRDKRNKTAVFDALDQPNPVASADAKNKFLASYGGSESDTSSSLEDEDDDAPSPKRKALAKPSSVPAKRRKVEQEPQPSLTEGQEGPGNDDSSSEDEDEDAHEDDWSGFVEHHQKREDEEPGEEDAAEQQQNIEISLGDAPEELNTITSSLNAKKRGPSKRDRQIRNSAHALHVQSLMYHNYVRNDWVSRKELHDVLKDALSDGCRDEVERWRSACDRMLGRQAVQDESKSKQKKKTKQSPQSNKKSKGGRDWGSKATAVEDEILESNTQSDPTLRLLKTLSSFWKKRYRVVAPGLRKQGWKSVPRLGKELKAFQANMGDQATYGERIESFDDFKAAATKAEGSRDLGAQLFTALLRAVGVEARLVSNLQVIGFGWSKSEEADPPKKKDELASVEVPTKTSQQAGAVKPKKSTMKPTEKPKPARNQPGRKEKSKSGGTKELPIDLSDDDSPLSSPPPSDSDEESLVDVTHLKQIPTVKRHDRDLPFPVYWTEVLSPLSNTWIPVDPIVLSVIANSPTQHHVFEPRGAGADRSKQVLAYVVAHNQNGSIKDVTTRYMKNRMWPGKTKSVRVPIEKIPVHNKQGKVRKYEEYDWFKHVLSMYTQPGVKRTAADDIEDERDLKPLHSQRDSSKSAGEETLQGYKNSAEFVLERHLRREEAVKPGCSQVKTFRTGKGESAKDEPVYRRADIVRCKTVESWHKEGREVRDGAEPLKRVPMRAVTTIRKREIEATERETGEKMKQGLFSEEQTQWIIPPPIENGVIPKNAFGNIDVYVPTMVPKGAVHVPLRGTAKICRRLEIDFSEACTGFEFGNRMAVPVLTGVVIAAENRRMVVDAWRTEQEVIKKREQDKRDKLVMGTWKKMLAGLRVIERVRRDYGEDADKHLEKEMKSEMSKAGRSRKAGSSSTARKPRKSTAEPAQEEGHVDEAKPDVDMAGAADLGGGFIPEGQSVEIIERRASPPKNEDGDMAGGFILENDDEPAAEPVVTPTAPGKGIQSLRQRMAAAAEAGAQDDDDDDDDAKVDEPTTNGLHEDGGEIDLDLVTHPSAEQEKSSSSSKRATKEPPASKRRQRAPKTAISSLSSSDSDLDKHDDEDEDEDQDDAPPTGPSSQRSKYFESNQTSPRSEEIPSSDDDGEEDDEDDADFGSKSTTGRARGSGRGRGRGRGRRGGGDGGARATRGRGGGGGASRSGTRRK